MKLKKYTLGNRPKRSKKGFKKSDLGGWNFTCSRFKDDQERLLHWGKGYWTGGEEMRINLMMHELSRKGPVLVSAGHFMPNLLDLDYIGQGPLETTRTALRILRALSDLSVQTDFLLLVNDIHLPAADNHSNKFREAVYSPFIVPFEMEKLFLESRMFKSICYGLESIFYIGEKQLFNRFVHEIRRGIITPEFGVLSYKEGKYCYHMPDDCWFDLIDTSFSKCVCAVARLLKLISDSSYKTFVMVYPSCSSGNIERAIKIAEDFFGLEDLDIFIMYKKQPCF